MTGPHPLPSTVECPTCRADQTLDPDTLDAVTLSPEEHLEHVPGPAWMGVDLADDGR